MPSGDDLTERLRAALAGRTRARVSLGPRVRAAGVLVPIFERNGEPWIVLTKRAETMTRHRGEISFPGGTRDPGDADLWQTALREAHEEIGLDPRAVRRAGELDELSTFASEFVVSPFVGVFPDGQAWIPNDAEIAAIIELPLAELVRVRREERWYRGGEEFPMYIFEVDGWYIWGLTARMLHQLLDEVAGPLGLAP